MKQKTNLAGIGLILTAIGGLLSSGEFNAASISAAVTGVLAGLGLIFAKEGDQPQQVKPGNVTELPPQK